MPWKRKPLRETGPGLHDKGVSLNVHLSEQGGGGDDKWLVMTPLVMTKAAETLYRTEGVAEQIAKVCSTIMMDDYKGPNHQRVEGGRIVVDVKTYDARGNGEGGVVNTITGDHENRITDYTSLVVFNSQVAYGFFPQMKAEGISFSKELSGALVVGTNPGFQNGVLIVCGEEKL